MGSREVPEQVVAAGCCTQGTISCSYTACALPYVKDFLLEGPECAHLRAFEGHISKRLGDPMAESAAQCIVALAVHLHSVSVGQVAHVHQMAAVRIQRCSHCLAAMQLSTVPTAIVEDDVELLLSCM
jgi:hypothetical protein